MAAPTLPDPVLRFVAILWSDPAALEKARAKLGELWGTIAFAGADHPFDRSDYYREEMGEHLRRRLIAFRILVPPESLVEAKLLCNAVEDELAGPKGRLVNLDVGYLDHAKLVLASNKPAGQKIHLGRGIHADLVARYGHGRYQPFEWTFPDFRDGRYDEELKQMRSLYLACLRQGRADSSPLPNTPRPQTPPHDGEERKTNEGETPMSRIG